MDWATASDYRWSFPTEPKYRTETLRGGTPSGWIDLLRACFALRPQLLIVYGYHDVRFFLVAMVQRLFGATVISMNDSKFDDYRRSWLGDLKKIGMLLPYSGFLAATRRASEYIGYLVGERPTRVYHCAIDTARVGALARPAWQATAYEDRGFIAIGRFVEKKNYFQLLHMYEQYALASARPRRLRLIGYGKLEEAIRQHVASSETLSRHVTIDGYVTPADIPRLLGQSLALLLPSVEEQFGIVATEALAAGIPVVLSTQCGAADIVATNVNGYSLDVANEAGWLKVMEILATNEGLWSQLSRNALTSAKQADVSVFVQAASDLGRREARPSAAASAAS